MGDLSEPVPGSSPQEPATKENIVPTHTFLFHHEGPFSDGERIVKGFNWGAESTLVIDAQCAGELRPTFSDTMDKYDESLPQQELFSNGLSRRQAVEVLAAQEVILGFNGGFLGEHALSRNLSLYSENDEGEATLSDFKGKGALTCVESAAVAEQLLSDSQEMTYVSGAADLNGSGQFEMHSFNLIKPGDPQYAAAILDVANPIVSPQGDGTSQVKLYCAPITPEKLKSFKRNETLEIDYGGEIRRYQFKTPGGTEVIW